MSMKHIGARRKRTNTPALNRRRVAAYRHRPYAPVKKQITSVNEEILNETASEILEEAAVIEEQAEEKTAEALIEETTESKPEVAEESEASPVSEAAAAFTAGAAGLAAKISSMFKGLFAKKTAEEPVITAAEPEEISVSEEAAEETPAEAEETVQEKIVSEEIQETETAEAEVSIEETEAVAEEVQAEETAEPIEESAEETAEKETEPEVSEAEETETADEEENEVLTVSEDVQAEESEVSEPSEDNAAEVQSEEVKEAAEPVETDKAETADTETEQEQREPEEIKEETPAAEGPAEEVSAPETESEEVSETPQEPEEDEAPLTKKEQRELKKEIRKETKKQLIDEIIDAPRANILLMLVAPGLAMKRVSSVTKTTISAPAVFILNVLKWAAVGTFYAMFIEKFINIFNYSFIRMNFTGTAGLAFRFGAFGFVAEYLSWIVISLFCGLIRRKTSVFKLMDVEGRSAPAVTLLFAAACVLVWKDMLMWGFIAAVCGTVIGFMTKGYGMDLTLPIGKNTQLVLVLLIVAGVTYAAFKYFPIAVSGLDEIFKAILNI